MFGQMTPVFSLSYDTYRVIQNFASPSRAEMGQAPVKLTISPFNIFNLKWENQILASKTC